MEKTKISINGMDCASCAINIERKLKKLNGVRNAVVNYATNRAVVEYDETAVKPTDFKEAIEKLGYGAELRYETKATSFNQNPGYNKKTDERIKEKHSENDDYENIAPDQIDREKLAREKEMMGLKNRVFFSAILTIPVLILAFPEMLNGIIELEYPEFFMSNMAILQFILSTPVLALNRDFFIKSC